MKLRTGVLCILLAAIAQPVHPQSSTSSDQSETIRLLMERVSELEKRVQELESKPKEDAKTPPPISSGAVKAAESPAQTTIPQGSSTSVATVASNGPIKVSHPVRIAEMHDMHGEHSISKTSTGEPTSPNGDANAAPGGATQNDQMESTAAAAQPTYPSLHIMGFGGFLYQATNFPGSVSTFFLPQYVLHFASTLSPKLDFFSEMSFSPTGGSEQRVVEIERAVIRYQQSDYFKLSFGRYHTPISYWNTAFHHGTWLQTTANRPEMIVFGGSFLPPHFVGILVEGAAPTNGLNFNYQFGVGNGRGFPISRAGTAGDVNNNKAWLTNLFVKPDSLHHLQVGGSLYHDLISQPDGRLFHEFITSGHVVWISEKPEVIAEFANVHHRQTATGFLDTGHISDSQAGYVQVAYRLPWFQEVLKPFYRYEYIHVPRSDGAFATAHQPTLSGSFIGLRYDATEFAALKVEYDRKTRRDEKTPEHILILQTDFTF